MTPLSHVILAALIAAAAGLWVRRSTWPYRWERAGTINIAAMLVSITCMAPAMTDPFDRVCRLVHLCNAEDLIGHLAYLTGITALTHAMIARLDLPDRRRSLRARIELPGTILLPTLVGCFVLGEPATHVRDLLMAPATGWLLAYWLVLCGTAFWVLGNLLWALFIIRQEPASRAVASIYIVAIVLDSAGMWAKIASLFVPGFPVELAWVLIGAAVVGYAVAAIYGNHRLRCWLAAPPPQTEPA